MMPSIGWPIAFRRRLTWGADSTTKYELRLHRDDKNVIPYVAAGLLISMVLMGRRVYLVDCRCHFATAAVLPSIRRT